MLSTLFSVKAMRTKGGDWAVVGSAKTVLGAQEVARKYAKDKSPKKVMVEDCDGRCIATGTVVDRRKVEWEWESPAEDA